MTASQVVDTGPIPVTRSHLSLKLQMIQMYYVYILKSSKSEILYYGYTSDLRTRLNQHNSGQTKFTKGHIPWVLAWYCAFPSITNAKNFELYLKSGSGKAFVYKRLVAKAKDDSVTD